MVLSEEHKLWSQETSFLIPVLSSTAFTQLPRGIFLSSVKLESVWVQMMSHKFPRSPRHLSTQANSHVPKDLSD